MMAKIWVVAGLALITLGSALVNPAGATTRPTLRVVRTPTGPILTDAAGRTLYTFVDDLLTTAPSACTGDCANDWHPAIAPRHLVVGAGITGEVGMVMRAGGQRQLTMDHRPLYTFRGDQGTGELRGNGVGNRWWAMTPTGLTATQFAAPHATYGPPSMTTLTVVRTAWGPVVANSRGEVLYAFADDTATTSACVADWCLIDWPPLHNSSSPSAPPSVMATLGVLDRPDGIDQVVLGGHLLYTFAGDLHPGDTRGQGIGGDWYLVSPAGTLVKTKTGK